MLWLWRSMGGAGDGKVEGVDGLNLDRCEQWPLLPLFEMVSWTALGIVNARSVSPSRCCQAWNGGWGKESARGGRGEDCTLGVVVHGHCRERVLVDCCLRCRAGRMHGIIEEVVQRWSTMRMREFECKKESERKTRRTTEERQRKRRSKEREGWEE
ncbi:uncharacterized protein FOMMEDRAFT_163784 [Fomitiporia mediterranea MF3/22]|uniref:Uncharacterized protein n=1 Tax=Fomitiporia mediterranea (strain MF3/22) TaxID=694068 RepID=R7SGD6_FOMME|nr:uncharacterized protein FOMMEDRAFT_163784 [Fomitiporia mediterranea MF3/22]EJC97357.1 hypothetical protein FOMMEDRAFT_163784 [Fomitiporia mediterranea MF3/22]